jgi:hypothetical protein
MNILIRIYKTDLKPVTGGEIDLSFLPGSSYTIDPYCRSDSRRKDKKDIPATAEL